MTDNNVRVDAVEALMFPGNRPASLVAAAPLTVIAPAGSNNTATVAFAVATTTGTAAAAQGVSAATLAATGDDTAAPTHVAALDATLVAMMAPSEAETVVMSGGGVSAGALSLSGIADAAQTEALTENELVEMAAAAEAASVQAILPYCLNAEDFVASLLSDDKTGVASSAGRLDEDAPPLAEPDAEPDRMELHYYRSHKASFNAQAFPPGEVSAKNTKLKQKIQIDHIRNVVHTWHD